VTGDALHWTAIVLRSPFQAGIGVAAAAATVLLAVWLPNLGLVAGELTDGALSPLERASFLANTLMALGTAFSPADVAIIAALAVLVGLNVAGTVALLRLRAGTRGSGAVAAGGAIGLLAVGCSACGVGLLGSVLGAGTAATVLAALPLGGLEFGLVGIGLLAVTFSLTGRRALRPAACDIAPR
jgi:hypothetical protein